MILHCMQYAPFKATKYIFEYNYDNDVALWGVRKKRFKKKHQYDV